MTPLTSLAQVLARALASGDLTGLTGATPVDRRDRFLTLLAVYDLHTAPLEVVGDAARHQHAPEVAAVKARLEAEWLVELEAAWETAETLRTTTTADEAVKAMRVIAAKDRLPDAYRWLAKDAGWAELVDFLALEGGPDGGFDDLVAVCQVGLAGSAKLELGKNYWDEMGQGDPDGVHTVLHDRLVAALDMPRVPRSQMPVEALERAALGGLLATNRWLQPEMLGALGLLELQAGPRCRLVLQAFDRLGAPADAYPFYVEHAEVDPVHGKDWLDKAIAPTVAERPEWGPRIVKGAWWRSQVNLAFFEAVRRSLVGESVAA
ncbi:MAG: iron-containing redox enzyme family protein [Mycobacteriales bacterium]|nr:iron-containing redox enzyme family protein [Mycobacteriales bacterium]